jgi:hypothetical protein
MTFRFSRTVALIVVSLPIAAARAQSRTFGDVSVGLSMQNDQGMKRTPGVEESRFQLSPIGIVTGVGLQHVHTRTGSIGVRVNGAMFPLISASTITDVSGAASLEKKQFLVLGSIEAEWSPGAVDGATGWPWFLSAGAVHALLSPRSGTRSGLIAGAGLRHRLKKHTDLKMSVELLAPSIGKTFLQVPVAAVMHW